MIPALLIRMSILISAGSDATARRIESCEVRSSGRNIARAFPLVLMASRTGWIFELSRLARMRSAGDCAARESAAAAPIELVLGPVMRTVVC